LKVIKEVKPIGYYLKTVYPVTVYAAPEGGYVAEIEDLPGCITEGETLEEVFQRIEDTRRAWIEIQYEDGAEIPLPRTEQQYSGKFVVRIPKGLHRQLAEEAKRQGVSLNQYVETLLATKATLKDISDQMAERLKELLTMQLNASLQPYGYGSYVFKVERKSEAVQCWRGRAIG
jgi:antitoxin HicB